MNAKRRAASLLLGVLVAACVGTSGTPTPAGSLSPAPSPSPMASPSPTAAPTDKSTASIIAVAAGSWHTCAVTGGGGVKCWGLDAGELVDGTTIPDRRPDRRPGPHERGQRDHGKRELHLRAHERRRGQVLGLQPVWPARKWLEDRQHRSGRRVRARERGERDRNGRRYHACALTGEGRGRVLGF